MTINQSSASAFINWQSFNIGIGQTTTFNQPSASSVTWNYISDPSASSINGNINANGYVVLQNPNGFTIGGAATISAHGLVMTTAATPALDLSSGGAWSFSAPPPTAKIINYGQINIAGGGSAYLIAGDIENNGTISAPNGKIGLYAGQQVLVSMSPDGRGLSAAVTLPQGSVDNQGNLIADAGSIVAQAKVVNQNGLVQANSVQNVNGTIELVASDSVNLGATSVISAQGGGQGASSGGSVTIKSDNTFSDQAGSTINIAGGVQGGNGGQVSICAPQMNSIQSTINGRTAAGFLGGTLAIDPANIWLASSSSDPNAPSGYTVINVNSYSGLSQISLLADNNIELSTIWNLANQAASANLSLTAGNNITFDDGSVIKAGNNWNVSLTAGTLVTAKSQVTAGNGGIYLNGSSYLQTQNGNLDLWAANEIIVGGGAIRTIGGGNIGVTTEYGNVNSGTSTSGYNYYALGTGTATSPYYTPFQLTGSGNVQKINFNVSNLGGIATAAGGNVTINAGADVVSFPTTTVAAGDPGIGAFGPELGNVTINAGGSVYGNFVEANGAGTINAGRNIGIGPSPSNPYITEQDVALSLVKGSWNLNAGWNPITQSVQSGSGDIYLQEVRNPNGVFNSTTTGLRHTASAGNHLFDYDPNASVTLTAGDGVHLTGYELSRPNGAVPLLLPPTLVINAGPGGVVLQTPSAYDANGNLVTLLNSDITLFPSAFGNLQITTTGGGWLSSANADGSTTTLLMSDSGQTRWFVASSGPQPFSETDHASGAPAELGNLQPVVIDLQGSQLVNSVPVLAGMANIILQTDKATHITVAGDMTGVSFYGANLNSGDVTSITVGGQIYNAGSFNSVTLDQGLPVITAADLPPATAIQWYSILELAVNPALLPSQSLSGVQPAQLASYLKNALLLPGLNIGGNLAYDANTKTLTAVGPLSSSLEAALQQPTLTLVRYLNGYPELDANGHFVTDTITWTPASSANAALITSLANASQGASPLGISGAYVVGGTGEFDVTAGSINLGNSAGILSVGNGDNFLGRSYSYLTPYITSGANIVVNAGYLEMPSSSIAALGGGNVTVTGTGIIPGSPVNSSGVGITMDLGSQSLLPFEAEIMAASNVGLGIYTTGGGNVDVTALGTINIDSSRIATFAGGNVTVLSKTGDVNAGSGGAIPIPVNSFSPLFKFPYQPVEYVYANGIVADTLAPLADGSLVPGTATLPGNISVTTPQGSIYADVGGILQETLNGTLLPGPTITLSAGTPNPPGDWNSKLPPLYGPSIQVVDNGVGDISLGNSGAIGGTAIVQNTGKTSGLLITAQNATITSQSLGSLTVLAGGTATVSSQGSAGGGITIIGAQGVNASGIGSGATVLGQNVSVNGAAATSTLGNSATATSTSSSAAGQSSSQSNQQVASTDNSDAGQNKNKKPQIRKVSRVTVLLSAAEPTR